MSLFRNERMSLFHGPLRALLGAGRRAASGRLRAEILAQIEQWHNQGQNQRDLLAQRQAALITQCQSLTRQLETMRIQQARLLAEQHASRESDNLRDYEFQVFSQWGEDGILQFLTRHVEIANRTFIEFGVEDFTEANCRLLLLKDNWRGAVLDGSEENINRLQGTAAYWKHDLAASAAFITTDNINELLQTSGFDEDLGILSIDVDGVDYWILKAITGFRPRILVLEYNAVFGADRPITVPYDKNFVRTNAHHSNLYFGASLAAWNHLAEQRGYALLGTNSAGTNAFFVRDDLLGGKIRRRSLEEAFTPSVLRESRDAQGRLNFLAGDARRQAIQGLPVVNVVTGANETL